MKELTLEILEKALEDWSAPIDMAYDNATSCGLCYYFKKRYKIRFYGKPLDQVPWAKHTIVDDENLYHFSSLGNMSIGRRERVIAIKGMIKDLKAKQNEDINKS